MNEKKLTLPMPERQEFYGAFDELSMKNGFKKISRLSRTTERSVFFLFTYNIASSTAYVKL